MGPTEEPHAMAAAPDDESEFGTRAGRLYSDLRQRMNDGTLEERMWAKVNMDCPV